MITELQLRHTVCYTMSLRDGAKETRCQIGFKIHSTFEGKKTSHVTNAELSIFLNLLIEIFKC